MKHDPGIEHLKTNKAFYVVAVCFAVDIDKNKCLLLKRSLKEKVHPGKWAPIGGKLEWEDLLNTPPTRDNDSVDDWEHIIETLLKREALEESNITISNFHYIDSVAYIRSDGMPSICLKFAARYISGEARAMEDFIDHGWFGVGEMGVDESVLGVPSELKRAIECFKK